MRAVLRILGLGLLVVMAVLWWPRPARRASGPLWQEAYVWQRAWTGAVSDAVAERGPRFARLVLLRAEVGWDAGRMRVVRADLDTAAVRRLGCPVGLALRIGAFPGPFGPTDPRTLALTRLARSLVEEAKLLGIPVSELQLDFDCPESRLDGYRVWVEAIRTAIAPVPLTVTALPSWLGRRGFARLVRAADGFVLQVHSLERPARFDAPFSLCDTARALRAVERAARVNRPFRVALPTYGYLVGFDAAGAFLGLAADGPALAWPAGTRLRDVRADPRAMSGLVRHWTRERPANLEGVIWYRLPVAGDHLNWSWVTLSDVMDGRTPRPALRAEAVRARACLWDVILRNAGAADAGLPGAVTLRWRGADLVGCDGLRGYAAVGGSDSEVRFVRREDLGTVRPGQRRGIGWVRLSRDVEVWSAIED